MYKKVYGIIETLAPLHVGASAGEESGNLNLIFRDQFTQTGIIPGSSIRGRLRAEMRSSDSSDSSDNSDSDRQKAKEQAKEQANYWYGNSSESRQTNSTSESIIKLEHASIVWLPVFCPGQPIIWVSSPYLLKRYQRIAGEFIKVKDKLLKDERIPDPYYYSQGLKVKESKDKKYRGKKFLFFNLGFLTLKKEQDLSPWFPLGKKLPAVIVDDNDIGMIHDMALYRQSRVKLEDEQKKVDTGAFFNVEALPEGTLLVFPIAIKPTDKNKKWQPLNGTNQGDIYLGGLESVGFGHCNLTLKEV